MNKRYKVAIFALIDLIALALSWGFAFLCCGENAFSMFAKSYHLFFIDLVVMIILFIIFGLYNIIWKYAGVTESVNVIEAFVAFTACNLIISVIPPIKDLGIAWGFVLSFIFIGFTTLSRFLVGYVSIIIIRSKTRSKKEHKSVIIIGGGDAGAMLIKEMKTSDKINMDPVCILDDDENKQGQSVCGVKVVGHTSEIVSVAKTYNADAIIISMPSVSEKIKSRIIAECQKTQCKVMTVPGLYQFAEGNLSYSAVKEVSVEDLLGRDPVKVNLDEIMGFIKHKVILVTGGGGSIGSELCRQIAKHEPKQLIILDIYENNAYDIQQELKRHQPNLNLEVLIASVRDSNRVNSIFEKYKPDIVFHAAAHKHVPLMEHSPNEAVKNNVSGTYKVADAAGRNGCKKFILISTDKAVNPTNIMGASKRICEMIVQTMNKVYPKTNYAAVRFGNVLGSNGSVIPLFKKQIEDGGPVTVTHKEIERFFMLIPEAVSLVLQAGAFAKGGEIFVLDMGNQVKIYDLAINMIRLSGLEPYKDIDIKITGLRPGEKLYEERLMDEEGMKKTANDMISIGKPIEIDEENLFSKVQELYLEAYKETDKMKQLVHELVPTYKIDMTDNGENPIQNNKKKRKSK